MDIKITKAPLRVLFLLFLALPLFLCLDPDGVAPDLSLKQNENEYYNDTIFDELSLEEASQDESEEAKSDESSGQNDVEIEENEDEEDKNIMREWEQYMYDFVPADMLTYEIEKGRIESFFEEITQTPSYVRGAYFVSSDEKGRIDFSVIDPKNRTIQARTEKREGLFYFNATTKGVYTFIFVNVQGNEKKQITFAIHCGNSTEQILKNEHLSPLQQRIMSIEQKLNV